jgi:flagellar biosynthesis protein FlhF
MVIRSFTAESVAAALKQVRSQLGGEAVVLKTKVVDNAYGGRVYEVTACLDTVLEDDNAQVATAIETAGSVETTEPVAGPARAPKPNPRVEIAALLDDSLAATPPAGGRMDRIEEKLDRIAKAGMLAAYGLDSGHKILAETIGLFRKADVPETFIREFVEQLDRNGDLSALTGDIVRERLIARIETLLDTDSDLQPGDRVVVVGLAGAGKTSVLGRLAADLTLNRRIAVKLVTLDNAKVGAFEEIASYGDLLGIEDVAGSNVDYGQVVRDKSGRITLIDTPALPVVSDRLSELRTRIDKLQPTRRILVVSALTRTSDVIATVRNTAWLQPTELVLAHADLTETVGGIIAAAIECKARVSMIASSANGAAGLIQPSAEMLADRILNRGGDRE